MGGGEGVEAEVDGGGSTPIVVSTLFFLKEQFKELSSPTCCYGYISLCNPTPLTLSFWRTFNLTLIPLIVLS